MKFDKLVVLVPCHDLEDFPVHLGGQDAESLLAAWTALWHPALVAACQTMPAWCPADEPPDPSAATLLTIPGVSVPLLPEGWPSSARGQGACVLDDFDSRSDLIGAALAALGPGACDIDPDLVADFLALGYGYLQVELLTREMRYTSHVDDIFFGNLVTKAAAAAMAGDRAAADGALQTCFDTLAESRDHYYPVESYLVDLMLVGPTTIGAALRDQLSSVSSTNLLMTGRVVEQMTREQPDTLDQIKQALSDKSVSLVGGEHTVVPLPLATHESLLTELLRGQAVYERWLGTRATIYGRDRYGLSPVLPGVLRQTGFVGALHFTLDGGVTPQPDQCKASWQGVDGSAIDVLARPPQPIIEAGTLLNLAPRLGHSMERDHVATLPFARWPGEDCWWFEDLRRVAARGSALGRFVTLDEYFSTTDVRGEPFRFSADEYRWPYLERSAEEGDEQFISRPAVHLCAQAEAAATSLTRTVAALVSPCDPEGDNAENRAEDSSDVAPDDRPETHLAAIRSAVADGDEGGAVTDGLLVANPLGTAAVALVDAPQSKATRGSAAVPVPAYGYTWVSGRQFSAAANQTPVPLASGNVLRNEHMEVTVNEATGAIQAVQDYRHRGNLLSAQLAFRDPRLATMGAGTAAKPSTEPYSVMAADEVVVTVADVARGEITSRGRLLDRDGQVLARFVQRLQLVRHRPVVDVDVELEIDEPPGDDPRISYYAWRSAWADTAAELWRSDSLTSQPTEARRLVAPHFVDIRGRHRLAVLCGGLPFHVRSGERTLDTLLVAGNERTRRFQFGIGVGLEHPLAASLELLTPLSRFVTPTAGLKGDGSGWFFHIDRKNVIATAWEPLTGPRGSDGFRVRLLETEGRSAQVRLASFRAVGTARRTDLLGRSTEELRIDEGRVCLRVDAYGWTQVEARW